MSDSLTSKRAWTTCERSWTPSEVSRPRSSGTPKVGRCVSCSPRRTRSACVPSSCTAPTRNACERDDYPWAPTWEQRVADARTGGELGRERRPIDDAPACRPRRKRLVPSPARAALSPAGARDLILMNSQVDVRDVLPSVQCPTLVFHRTDDLDARVDEGRYIAERIPGARLVELPGRRPRPVPIPEVVLDELEEFLTGARPIPGVAASSPRSSSPTSSSRPTWCDGSAIAPGQTCSQSVTLRYDPRLAEPRATRSTPPVTASSRCSTALRAPFARRSPSVTPSGPSGSRSARESTPARSSARRVGFAGSPCTSPHACSPPLRRRGARVPNDT